MNLVVGLGFLYCFLFEDPCCMICIFLTDFSALIELWSALPRLDIFMGNAIDAYPLYPLFLDTATVTLSLFISLSFFIRTSCHVSAPPDAKALLLVLSFVRKVLYCSSEISSSKSWLIAFSYSSFWSLLFVLILTLPICMSTLSSSSSY